MVLMSINDQLRHLESTFSPSWRWASALDPPSAEIDWRRRRLSDEMLDRARKFVEIWRCESLNAAEAWDPAIAAAQNLQADTAAVRKLKLLILGTTPVAEISLRLALDADTIRCWELLHFDVRTALAGSSWIYHKVIAPEERSGELDFARKMRLAWMGGVGAARVILDLEDAKSDVPYVLPYTEAERLTQRRMKWRLEFEAACDRIANTPRGATTFINAHGTLLERERRLRLASQRLEEKCREAARRHQIDLLKHQCTLEREKRLTAAAAREAAEIAASNANRQAEVLTFHGEVRSHIFRDGHDRSSAAGA